MKTPRIVKAVGHIDDDLINSATKSKKGAKKNIWLKWTSLAASFVVIIIVAAVAAPTLFGDGNTTLPVVSGDSTTINNSESAVSTTNDNGATTAPAVNQDTTHINNAEPTTSGGNDNTTSATNIEKDTKKNGTDIIWNEVSIPNVSLMLYKDPLAESYTFTFEDFVNYIGCDPTPGYLPEGYNKDYSDTQNLFFDPDGKPTDYYSFYTLRYSSKSGSVAIRVGKSLINSHSDVPIERDKIKASEINGIKMDLFKNMNTSETEENGMPVYMASFSQNGINYYAYSQGNMSADDFLKVISSID